MTLNSNIEIHKWTEYGIYLYCRTTLNSNIEIHKL